MKDTKSGGWTLRWLVGQIFLAITVAQARNDVPPTSARIWLPPKLSEYENQLASQRFREVETGLRVPINPRKTYNLAQLIDIAERNNPETRAAWERARQAAAAVGLSESAYYPFIVASAAAGYDRAFIPFPTLSVNRSELLTNPSGRCADLGRRLARYRVAPLSSRAKLRNGCYSISANEAPWSRRPKNN